MARVVEATRSMSTPEGSAATRDVDLLSSSSENLQFPPPRHDLGAHSQRTAELLGRSHRLLGGLPVDVENPGEGEDKLGALLQGHVSVLRSAPWKRRVIVPGSSPSIRAHPRKSPMLKTLPWVMRRSPRMASPSSSDRQHGRIRPR